MAEKVIGESVGEKVGEKGVGSCVEAVQWGLRVEVDCVLSCILL